MDANWKLIKQELTDHKDELVLNNFEVVCFKGILDGDDDYYYIVEHYNGNITHISAVCSVYPLKGKITEKEYEQLKRTYNYIRSEDNHCK